MLVKDEWIAMPAIDDSTVTAWRWEFDAVPAELRAAARRSTVFKPAPVDRPLFPPDTRFVSEGAIAAAFASPHSLEERWASFKRQYRSQGWVSFSDVLVTSDGLDALVYSEASCGGLCGEGAYVWLHRARQTGPWSIMKSITDWIA